MSKRRKNPADMTFITLVHQFMHGGCNQNEFGFVFPIDPHDFMPTKAQRMGLKDWRESGFQFHKEENSPRLKVEP